jgi:protein disulfide-isomerase A6
MLVVLLAPCRSEYVEITNNTIDKIVGGSRPAFVKFYSPWCGHCIDMLGAFSEASTRFPHVVFGGVNCAELKELCHHFGVEGYPTIVFYPRNNATGIEYSGDRTVDAFVSYVENAAQSKASPSPINNLINLTQNSWPKRITPTSCGLVLFHFHYCDECSHLRPQLAHAASIFAGDSNVVITTIDCEFHTVTCKDVGVHTAADDGSQRRPQGRLFSAAGWENYSRPFDVAEMVAEVSRKCALDRRIDGLLGEAAGRIAAADEIAQRFVDADDHQQLIVEMKKIEGAELYVTVMERFVHKRFEQMKKDFLVMKKSLEQRMGSIAVLDGIKRRLNVMSSFLVQPKPPGDSPQAEL